jgi:hypothetical protein
VREVTRSHRRFNWFSSLAVAVYLVGSPGVARAEEKISAEARGYFKNGVELLQGDAPNYQDAYYQFKLAYENSKSWKVLGNYGLCALKLERDGEAIAFYEEYLKRGGKHINKDEREAIDRDLLLVKGNDATLQLTSRVEEFALQDARSGSLAPAQSYSVSGGRLTLIVRAGQHHLVATASDGRSVSWDFSVEPGQTASHDFDFDPHPAAAVTEEPKASPQPMQQEPAAVPSEHNTTLRTAGFVTAGVGLLVLGGAGVTGLMAKNKESSAKSQCSADHVCDPALQSEFDKAGDLAHVSNYLLVGGGVVTVVGVTMIALGFHGSGSKSSQSARAIRLLPLLSPSQGGLIAEGQF